MVPTANAWLSVSPSPRIVIMGVSGCGKSTLAQALAQRLGLPFVEGDSLHPARNVALMAAGTPLTDEDRHDWLAAVAVQLAANNAPDGVVVSCSALKRRYRDQLRLAGDSPAFVHLHGERTLLEARLAARTGHYMPVTLLQSQLDTLQLPSLDEQVMPLDMALPVAEQVERVIDHFGWAPDS
jgi:gluconokinase